MLFQTDNFACISTVYGSSQSFNATKHSAKLPLFDIILYMCVHNFINFMFVLDKNCVSLQHDLQMLDFVVLSLCVIVGLG